MSKIFEEVEQRRESFKRADENPKFKIIKGNLIEPILDEDGDESPLSYSARKEYFEYLEARKKAKALKKP